MQTERHVVEDRQVRKQRIVLKDHADPACRRRRGQPAARQQAPSRKDLSGIDWLEAGDAAQRRCLAAAARTEQAADCTLRQRQVQPGNRDSLSEAPLDAAQFKPHARLAGSVKRPVSALPAR